jgi:uncharacterized short protein YbdD (DUF466 family)
MRIRLRGPSREALMDLSQEARQFWDKAAQFARAMAGIPNYQAYVEHMSVQHPDQAPLSEAEFFRWCQDTKYGPSGFKCC